jgi:hypothetical protein
VDTVVCISGDIVIARPPEAVFDGRTRVWWSEDLRMGGWSSVLLPVLRITAERREHRRWARLKDRLETAATPEPALV